MHYALSNTANYDYQTNSCHKGTTQGVGRELPPHLPSPSCGKPAPTLYLYVPLKCHTFKRYGLGLKHNPVIVRHST